MDKKNVNLDIYCKFFTSLWSIDPNEAEELKDLLKYSGSLENMKKRRDCFRASINKIEKKEDTTDMSLKESYLKLRTLSLAIQELENPSARTEICQEWSIISQGYEDLSFALSEKSKEHSILSRLLSIAADFLSQERVETAKEILRTFFVKMAEEQLREKRLFFGIDVILKNWFFYPESLDLCIYIPIEFKQDLKSVKVFFLQEKKGCVLVRFVGSMGIVMPMSLKYKVDFKEKNFTVEIKEGDNREVFFKSLYP